LNQKPSNSSLNGTAPSLSHPNNVKQYTIEHGHSVTHSVYVGSCMDFKNMQGMNITKNARQGCLTFQHHPLYVVQTSVSSHATGLYTSYNWPAATKHI